MNDDRIYRRSFLGRLAGTGALGGIASAGVAHVSQAAEAPGGSASLPIMLLMSAASRDPRCALARECTPDGRSR